MQKILLSVLVLSFPSMAKSQIDKLDTIKEITFEQGKISGHILSNDSLLQDAIYISLNKNNVLTKRLKLDQNGWFSFNNLSSGNYALYIESFLMKRKTISNINIESGVELYINTSYPDACKESKKRCPKDHSNKIIPILYGLPSDKSFKKAEKGKLKLGGCILVDCSPKWHCRIHLIDF